MAPPGARTWQRTFRDWIVTQPPASAPKNCCNRRIITLAGRHIYGSGVMSVYAEAGKNLLALALFYLSSYNGEAGHNCPLACTAGVIKTLQHAGDEELKVKYLPGLLDSDDDQKLHGAQFLTEVQGGSDVGANACTATLVDAKQNQWLINGEKWFCSNASADLVLMTARPENGAAGTKGPGVVSGSATAGRRLAEWDLHSPIERKARHEVHGDRRNRFSRLRGLSNRRVFRPRRRQGRPRRWQGLFARDGVRHQHVADL